MKPIAVLLGRDVDGVRVRMRGRRKCMSVYEFPKARCRLPIPYTVLWQALHPKRSAVSPTHNHRPTRPPARPPPAPQTPSSNKSTARNAHIHARTYAHTNTRECKHAWMHARTCVRAFAAARAWHSAHDAREHTCATVLLRSGNVGRYMRVHARCTHSRHTTTTASYAFTFSNQ